MQTFKQFLIEGGQAIPGTSRINQLNVDSTLSDIYDRFLPVINIDKSKTVLLGSTGKKNPEANGGYHGTSGDIDLAVPSDIDTDTILKAGKDLGYNVRNMSGINVVSIAWPIVNTDGKQEDQFVQLDIMPVNSLEWAEWAYFSPSYKESQYKGLFRNEIMYAVAKYAELNIIDQTDDGLAVAWERLFFDLNKGLMKGTQSRVGSKGSLLKNAKTTSKEVVSNNPDEIAKILFGDSFSSKDLMTWEDTLKAVTSPKFKYKDKLKDILVMTSKGIKGKGQDLPPELEKYL